MISRSANRRRLVVTTRRKLAASPAMPALARIADSALSCSSAPNTGLRTRRLRSGLSAISASNCSRSFLTESIALSSRARSNNAPAYRPAIPEMMGSSPATLTLVLATSFTVRHRHDYGGANHWNPKRNSDFPGFPESPRKPLQNRGLANTAATAVQHGELKVASVPRRQICIAGMPRQPDFPPIACARRRGFWPRRRRDPRRYAACTLKSRHRDHGQAVGGGAGLCLGLELGCRGGGAARGAALEHSLCRRRDRRGD